MYKLKENGVIRLSDNANIPNNPNNRDWRKYQVWVAEGNTPDPEFTADELAAQKQRKKRQIEMSIVDMRLRKDAANAEGFAGLEAETQAELDKLRTELSETKVGL